MEDVLVELALLGLLYEFFNHYGLQVAGHERLALESIESFRTTFMITNMITGACMSIPRFYFCCTILTIL